MHEVHHETISERRNTMHVAPSQNIFFGNLSQFSEQTIGSISSEGSEKLGAEDTPISRQLVTNNSSSSSIPDLA
jgi:hypothetical protein